MKLDRGGLGLWSLRARLTLLALASALPVALFAVLLGVAFVRSEREDIQDAAFRRVEALAHAVDRYVASLEATLQVLATSPALRRDDLAAFHAHAREVARIQGLGIVLADAAGRQVMNTARAPGEPLPPRRDLETHSRTLAGGRVQVSGVVTEAVFEQPIVSVEMPVRLGADMHVLAIAVAPDALAQLVRDQRLPQGWYGGILDRTGAIVARVPGPSALVGRPSSLVPQPDPPPGDWFAATTTDGVPVYAATLRSALTAWTIAVAVPRHAFDAALWQLGTLILAGALAVVAFGAMLGRIAGWGVVMPLKRLALAAAALGRGEPIADETTGIAEIDEVRRAMRDAGRELEARAAAAAAADARVRESEQRLRASYDRAPVGIAETDTGGRILRVNDRFCDIAGRPRAAIEGSVLAAFTHPEDAGLDAELAERLRDTGTPSYAVEKRMLRGDGTVRWVNDSASLVRDGDGRPVYAVHIVRDIALRKEAMESLERSERSLRQALAEKDVLLREVHHRVKNNLQLVVSMINLGRSLGADPADVRQRILAMSLVHDLLHRTTPTGLLDYADYLERLCGSLEQQLSDGRVRIARATEHVPISLDAAIPLGLIVNEVVTNAFKHAFPGGRSGTIEVVLRREPGSVVLRICDDGIGGPAVSGRGFGSRLVAGLAQQLDAEIATETGPRGTRFELRLDPRRLEPRPP